MKLLRRILLCLLLLCSAAPLSAAVWERIEMSRLDPSEAEHVEVDVRESYVYVSCNRPVTVKVCTILGQVISQEKLAPGVHRLQLRARGVYILKAGSVTKRVNI